MCDPPEAPPEVSSENSGDRPRSPANPHPRASSPSNARSVSLLRVTATRAPEECRSRPNSEETEAHGPAEDPGPLPPTASAAAAHRTTDTRRSEVDDAEQTERAERDNGSTRSTAPARGGPAAAPDIAPRYDTSLPREASTQLIGLSF